MVPTGKAMEESVDLAYEIFNRVFRRVPDRIERKYFRWELEYGRRHPLRRLIGHIIRESAIRQESQV